jgi:hypothetical protein
VSKWIEWVEPYGPNNEPVYMRVTPETAIAKMRSIHAGYTTDQQALDELHRS